MHTLFITSSQLFSLEITPLFWSIYFIAGTFQDLSVPVLGTMTLVMRMAWKLPWTQILKALASGVALIEAIAHERRRKQRKSDHPAEAAQIEQRPFWSSIALWAALLAFIESVVALFSSFIR